MKYQRSRYLFLCMFIHWHARIFSLSLGTNLQQTQMQWVDWKFLTKEKIPEMMAVFATCDDLNLKRIMSFQYPWCNELTCQFFATLFVDKDPEKTMHWMTCGRWYSVTYEEFSRILGFNPHDAFNVDRIHDEKPKPAKTMAYMYDTSGHYEFGTTAGLIPFYDYLNKLFRKTLAPKGSDASRISSYSLNLLHRMREDPRRFDVFNYIWEEIRLSSSDSRKDCVYAPYIMCMIEHITGLKFHKEQPHTHYQMRTVSYSRQTRAGSPPSPASPSSSSTKSIKQSLAEIFCLCRRNAKALDKISQRQKQLYGHLGIQAPSSSDSSDLEGKEGGDDDEEDVVEVSSED